MPQPLPAAGSPRCGTSSKSSAAGQLLLADAPTGLNIAPTVLNPAPPTQSAGTTPGQPDYSDLALPNDLAQQSQIAAPRPPAVGGRPRLSCIPISRNVTAMDGGGAQISAIMAHVRVARLRGSGAQTWALCAVHRCGQQAGPTLGYAELRALRLRVSNSPQAGITRTLRRADCV